MLVQLKDMQYSSIRTLIDFPETPSLYCRGIIEGKYRGKVLVESVDNPKSSLIIKDAWCFLVGDPKNAAFNQALADAIERRTVIDEGMRVMFFIEPSEAWLAVLQELVSNRQPIKMARRLYVATKPLENGRSLPNPLTLHPIDDSLPTKVDGELPDDVQKVLKLRAGAAQPDEMAFGFVAVNGRQCAAWAVVDFIVDGEGEIRLFTDAAHRRQGLAQAVSRATINYGLKNGLNTLLWDVATANSNSVKLAEKLELRLARQFCEYLIIFSEVSYLINLAWSALDDEDFHAVHATTQQMIIADEEILVQYGHFLSGAAWAGLNKIEQAIEDVNMAIETGFNDLAELEENPQLASLHYLPAWNSWMTTLKQA